MPGPGVVVLDLGSSYEVGSVGDPLIGGIPMYYVKGLPDQPGGATYQVSVSAGLNMSYWKQLADSMSSSANGPYDPTGSYYAFLSCATDVTGPEICPAPEMELQ